MKFVLRLLLVLALVAAGFWLVRALFPDPKIVINRRLHDLARLASFEPNETSFRRFSKVERLGQIFSEDAQVTVDVPGEEHVFNGRNELMQAAMASKQIGNGISVEFLDVNIELGTGKEEALVDLTLQAKVSGESDMIVQELKFTMKKIKGDWLITRIDTLKTLKQ